MPLTYTSGRRQASHGVQREPISGLINVLGLDRQVHVKILIKLLGLTCLLGNYLVELGDKGTEERDRRQEHEYAVDLRSTEIRGLVLGPRLRSNAEPRWIFELALIGTEWRCTHTRWPAILSLAGLTCS